MPGSADPARLFVVEKGLRELAERVEPLEESRGEVQALAQRIEEIVAAQKVSKPAPVWWPALSPEEHAERWPLFLAWLRDVAAARYPADIAGLRRCWADHPAAVDALTKAWLTWQAAELNRAAEPREAATWQVQWRPQLFGLATVELSRCSAETHVPPPVLATEVLTSFR